MGIFSWLLEEDPGEKAFREMSEGKNRDWIRQSQEEDIYYRPDLHAIIGPNPCFYRDGSLKYDSRTGKTYPRGQYYCDSCGCMADNSKAPSDMKRPPAN